MQKIKNQEARIYKENLKNYCGWINNVWVFYVIRVDKMRLYLSLLLYFTFINLCQASWIPATMASGKDLLSSSYQTIQIKGIKSGVGYSSDRILCTYVNYLIQNKPLPSNDTSKICSFSPVLTDKGVIIGNWSSTQEVRFRFKELYENNIRTVGEFMSYADKKGILPDELTLRYYASGAPSYVRPDNQRNYCIRYTLGNYPSGSGDWSKDPSCHRLFAENTTCSFQQNLSFDHGYVTASELTENNAVKDMTLYYSCPTDTTIRFMLPSAEKSIILQPGNGETTGSVESKLTIDGKSLHSNSSLGTSVLLNLKSGNHQLPLKSVLSGNGIGNFSGIALLVTSYQ